MQTTSATLCAVLLLSCVLSRAALALYAPVPDRCVVECALFGTSRFCSCDDAMVSEDALEKRGGVRLPFRFGKRAMAEKRQRLPFRYGKRSVSSDAAGGHHPASAYYYLPSQLPSSVEEE